MSDAMIISDDGNDPIKYIDRDELSRDELQNLDLYLDVVRYELEYGEHPNRKTFRNLDEFYGETVGGYTLETNLAVIYQLANDGELGNTEEWHSS